jgi:(heptosyl)LPS beta-1,4-glucosyltransferase
VKISATIITLNEERNIADAIASVAWVDEVIVVDSGSTDRTRDIAESCGARVIVNEWPGFSEQKQFAVDAATNDWILSLDADERVTQELRKEIDSLREMAPNADGYRIPRLSVYMGREIRHGGWYPDLQMRFFDRRCGKWNGAVIHESFKLNEGANDARLRGELIHYSVRDAGEHQRMIAERYAPLGARKMFDEGRRSSPINAVVSSWFAFVRSYFFKLGFLDGFPGFCIAYFAAHHTFMKHLLLIEIQNDRSGNNG